MKSVIIIYSKTGNTLSVANRLKEKMKSEILEVKAVSNDPNETKPKLTQLPDVTNYSHLVFASPVHGFSLSKVMETYLKQLPDLSGKTIDLFITHFFPFAWMGGTRTLKQMKTIIESKN
ncbi:MAG: flavodoxin domain-containing protein, partial [Bacillota bacterium]